MHSNGPGRENFPPPTEETADKMVANPFCLRSLSIDSAPFSPRGENGAESIDPHTGFQAENIETTV